MSARQRSPEEIRASIEANRQELGAAIERLQGEVREVTNWRARFAERQQQVLAGAAGAGFLLGGGIAAFTGLFRARRS
ncbi:MAG: DUF3618 domain-containing protein [Actinomycetota bacterium]|jgi:hypothetical protein|nr:DUF3618 domain-containing protein [Actinomycetota bacterium]